MFSHPCSWDVPMHFQIADSKPPPKKKFAGPRGIPRYPKLMWTSSSVLWRCCKCLAWDEALRAGQSLIQAGNNHSVSIYIYIMCNVGITIINHPWLGMVISAMVSYCCTRITKREYHGIHRAWQGAKQFGQHVHPNGNQMQDYLRRFHAQENPGFTKWDQTTSHSRVSRQWMGWTHIQYPFGPPREVHSLENNAQTKLFPKSEIPAYQK